MSDFDTEILDNAIETVYDRPDQHGEPENSFGAIADLWNAYLGTAGTPVTKKDTAIMLALLKVARSANGIYDEDNFVDMAGYAEMAATVADDDNDHDPSSVNTTSDEITKAELLEALKEIHDDGEYEYRRTDGGTETPTKEERTELLEDATATTDGGVRASSPAEGQTGSSIALGDERDHDRLTRRVVREVIVYDNTTITAVSKRLQVERGSVWGVFMTLAEHEAFTTVPGDGRIEYDSTAPTPPVVRATFDGDPYFDIE